MIKFIIFFLLIFNISQTEQLKKIRIFREFQTRFFYLRKNRSQFKSFFIDNRKVRVSNDGYFAFGLDRDRKNNVLIKIINKKSKPN